MAATCSLALTLLTAVLALGVADAKLTYTGPQTITVKDLNPTHTAAECVPTAGGAGCVPYTLTLTVSDPSFAYLYDVKTPSGVHLADGTLAAGSTGPISLLLPWGIYDLTFKVWGKGAPLIAAIPTTVIGLEDITSGLPISNCAATDAKHGVPYEWGLRWAWYALQKNNSAYAPGVAEPWYTGSASHYHTHVYWHLALDPLNKGAQKNVSFCRVVLPYFADGAPDYTGTLVDQFPTRTSNNNLAVTVGDYPFYGPNGRAFCSVIPNPVPPPQPAPAPAPAPLPAPGPIAPGNDPANPIGADFLWVCPEVVPSKYVVIIANQTVDPATVAPGELTDDYATKIALHYVQCFGPVYPTYPVGYP